ncbi:MAG: ribosome small subunit-dependent GTPase A [Firmicutes bacterium]|nr:ribosome small subunit-dependent GTPase A [Bacillota bacterium]
MASEGRVIRCHSNFFDVLVEGSVARAVVRGRLRLERKDILAGDRVEISSGGVIERVLPRKNEMVRPPVANVDKLLVVFTLESPPFAPLVVDKLLVLGEAGSLECVLCLNKADLYEPGVADDALSPYRAAGYRTVLTSALTGLGIDELREGLGSGLAVLAGQSGVGKSSILNALIPGVGRTVGSVSRKTHRGKHTTKGVELLRVPGGGLIADTPGFTRLELETLSPSEVSAGFPEIARIRRECRFADCGHRAEPDCAVKAAVARGEIAESRYGSYLAMMEEAELHDRRRYGR